MLQHHRIGRVGDYVSDFLALTSSQRGLKSGLSGRTNIWEIAFRLLRMHNRWLFGFGYRAGDRMVGTIDNGYIQLLFESGLIAGLMIFGSMLRVFYLLWQASRPRENNAWTRYYMVLWCLMIVYFLNNISARYLFSFGSPFSLCVLCLMAASRQELVGGGMHMRVMQEVKPPPRATRKTLLWNRSAR
jgi:O-antigen ligase